MPEGWHIVPVGELCSLVNGRAFKPSEWSSDGLPIIRIQNLNNPEASFNRFDGELDPKHRVAPGELLFAWSGTPGTSFGAHIWNGPVAALNQHIFRVLYDSDLVDKEYFRIALNSRLAEMIGRAQGGVGLAHITKGKFENTLVPIPPLSEQRRIVARIEELQERTARAREALQSVPTLLEQLRQSVLASAFRGDLTADWRESHSNVEPASVLLERIRAERRRRWEAAELKKMRAKGKEPRDGRWKEKYVEPEPVDCSRQPTLPEGWGWVSFDQLAWSLRSGTAATSMRHETNLPVLRSSAVRPGEIDYTDHNFLPEGACGGEDLVSDGDFLVTRLSGTLEYVGNCAVVHDLGERQIAFPDRLFRARVVGCVYAPFIELAFAATSLRGAMEEAAKSSAGHQRISLSDLRRFAIPLPSLKEQHAVADRVRALLSGARRIGGMNLQLTDSLSTLEASVLARAFRGDLVPQDPSDEPASVLLERIRQERGGHARRTGTRGRTE
jgi:type I restriction enzyme S subunit